MTALGGGEGSAVVGGVTDREKTYPDRASALRESCLVKGASMMGIQALRQRGTVDAYYIVTKHKSHIHTITIFNTYIFLLSDHIGMPDYGRQSVTETSLAFCLPLD